MVWCTASAATRCQARIIPRSTIQHTRLLSTTATRRAGPGSEASKQDRRDVAASNPNPTSLHHRFNNEQEKQRASPQPGHNLSGNTNYTSPAPPETQQSRPASSPIRTALGNRNRTGSASTSTNNLLSRFDNDSSLDFLTQPSTRSPRPNTSREARPSAPKPTGSLADDLQKMIQQMRHSKNDGSKPSDGRFDTSGMLSPQRPDGYDPLEAMKGFSLRTQPAPVDTSPPPFRIGPSLGRTVLVKPEANMDLARAFRSLDMKCNANSIKRDFNKQRFHERGGTKRKRLASERWRRRFKEAFKATIRRVQDMRRKGW